MNTKLLIAIIFLFVGMPVFSQRPPRPQGPPGMGGPPPRVGGMRPGDDRQRGGRPPLGDWMKPVDVNSDSKIDATELQTAIDASFIEFDKNSNGTIEANEMQRPPRDGGNPPMGQGIRPQGPPPIVPDGKKILPPFFFADRVGDGASTSRAEFERIVRSVFAEMDKNTDGAISREESHPPKRMGEDRHGQRGEGFPPPPPNAKFIAAELRFGDKLVKSQPFSAETLIEDSRRLYDGTTVTKQNRGAIYRDGAGRTRREQPLEMVGGVSIAGTDGKPQMLVFINDFATKIQYFLDMNNKVARKHGIGGNPPPEPGTPPDAKTESLGTKTIEGVSVEGTRITFEIPAGQIGNDKPIQVITEKWFSPDLQVLVMSRHLDPLAGEHVFKLVNIKRNEPAADLFSVPTGFRIENQSERGHER